MKPALAAALFHAPGVYVLAKRRLTPAGVKLNALAVGLTAAAMIAGGLARGLPGVLVAWAVAHTLWSAVFSRNVERLPAPRSP